MDADERGEVEECLKAAFLKKQLINRECQLEVATLIAETKADIHVDPILESACTVDLLRYCAKITSGDGRSKYRIRCRAFKLIYNLLIACRTWLPAYSAAGNTKFVGVRLPRET